MKIVGNTVGTTLPQPDWNQTDPKKGDFIRNKPSAVDGTTFTPNVDAEGNLSWKNNHNLPNPESVNIMGGTFTPHVDEEGNLSWSNDKNLPNPESVNIKGYTPERGKDYYTEEDKTEMVGKVLDSIPKITNVSTVRDAKKTTMTLTNNNGSKSTIVIDYGDNGDPSTITVDGEEVTLEFIYNTLYLFHEGDKFEDLTGGWEAISGKLDGHYGMEPAITFSDNTMSAEFSPTRITVGQVRTVNAIDLTQRSKLVFHITQVKDPASACLVGVIDDSSGNIVMVASAPVAVGDVGIDISNVTGSYKVGIVLKTTDANNGKTLVTVDSIGLE